MIRKLIAFINCRLRGVHVPGDRYLVEYSETGTRRLVVICRHCGQPYASYQAISLESGGQIVEFPKGAPPRPEDLQ